MTRPSGSISSTPPSVGSNAAALGAVAGTIGSRSELLQAGTDLSQGHRSGLEAPTTKMPPTCSEVHADGTSAVRSWSERSWSVPATCAKASRLCEQASLPATMALRIRWSRERPFPFPWLRAATRGSAVRAGMPAQPFWPQRSDPWPWHLDAWPSVGAGSPNHRPPPGRRAGHSNRTCGRASNCRVPCGPYCKPPQHSSMPEISGVGSGAGWRHSEL